MLIIMVIGITILGCVFKSYHMLGMLKDASSYAWRQQEGKKQPKQFTQESRNREKSSVLPQAASAPAFSSLKMNPHPFGPRLEIKRITNPFGPRLEFKRMSNPFELKHNPVLNTANYPASQDQANVASNTNPDPVISSSQLTPISGNPLKEQPNSPLTQIMNGWTGYVSTIENLEK